MGEQRQAPAALPPGKTRYPLYRRPGGPQGQSGNVRKISPPPGFDPRTVQSVASRYTDCAIPAHFWSIRTKFFTGLASWDSKTVPTVDSRLRYNSPKEHESLRATVLSANTSNYSRLLADTSDDANHPFKPFFLSSEWLSLNCTTLLNIIR
jgi:hypothetical protein